jgi:phospholipase D1/2
MTLLRIASYNVHCGIGYDGWFAPARIRDVLAEIDADVLALQEVESHVSGFDMLAWLAAETGLHAVAGPTLMRAGAHYGNAVLARRAPARVERIDLSVPGREPRGALDVDVPVGSAPLRVLATHLGLGPSERRRQVRRLLEALTARPAQRAILMGDLNEWFLWGRTLRWLRRHFETTPAPATFPAARPLLALDRIWVRPRRLIRRQQAHRSALARVASDHLPLVATLDLDADLR